MAELKTKKNLNSVPAFLKSIKNKGRQDDSFAILKLMKEVTMEKPVMWGSSIVGFGSYHYQYASGREGDWPMTGFSPRVQNLTIYIMPGFEKYSELMSQLGKHKTGKSCLYLKRLSDVDLTVLKKLIRLSVQYLKKKYPTAK